jgi:pyocin large subunit-like protein
MGPGAGPEILASTAGLAAQSDEDMAKLATLLPIYARIAEMPGASNATRNYYRWLRSQVTT